MTQSLVKNQSIDLKQKNGKDLRRIELGVGWEPIKKWGFLRFGFNTRPVDLDASCILFSCGQRVDQVWYRQTKSRDGSIAHNGNNLTGDSEGDDEVITINLQIVPPAVDCIILTVNSFSGQSFKRIKRAYGRVVDVDTEVEIGRYNLTDMGKHTGIVIGILRRQSQGWLFEAIGERASGSTFEEMAAQLKRIATQ